MKKEQKTVIIGERLYIINQLEKGENIDYIYYSLGLNKNTIFTIFNNAEKVKVLSQDLSCVP